MNHFPELAQEPRILLGPGPSMVHPRVMKAMAAPVVGHLDPYFLEIMDRTQELLRGVFQTENQLSLPISGTGSAAMEASLANVVEPGDPVLICANGYFGERLADMAARYGADVQVLRCPWGQVFTPSQVREALRAFPAKVTAIVHGETSTGALQPLDEIVKVVHDQGGIIIVDTVASLGGTALDVDGLDIDICYSGSQKCLSCPPGISPITFGARAEEILRSRKTAVSNWYLDMTMVQKYWGKERTYHHTAPISMNFAFYEALRLVAEEGLEHRWQRHSDHAALLWDGLEEMGLEMFVDPPHRLPSLTTVRVPDHVSDQAVRGRLLREYNIEIAGGLGEFKGKLWRIGLMGYSSRKENVLLLLSALRKIINQ